MGFLQSYLRLPRYQRVVLGLVGIGVGWYGPSAMNYLFVDAAPKEEADRSVSSANKPL